jgi:DNA polymerase-3 subunit epsilon
VVRAALSDNVRRRYWLEPLPRLFAEHSRLLGAHWQRRSELARRLGLSLGEIELPAPDLVVVAREWLRMSRDLAREFRVEEIAHDLIAFIDGAELIIHNAPFDVGFLDYEFAALPGNWPAVERLCKVTDSLALARHKHPGQKNNLDALCRRYMVDNSARALHGALLDAEILADVYLAMTGGQTSLFGQSSNPASAETDDADQLPPLTRDRESVVVVRATVEELVAHERLLDLLDERGGAAWRAVPFDSEVRVTAGS